MNELRDQKLVKNIIDRDEMEFLEVIEIYSPLLKTIVSKNLHFFQDDQEEVMNDIFLKIWENIEQFDSNRGSFRNWICGIANFRSIELNFMKL